MKRVDVRFKSAEVVKCNARAQTIQVKVMINDGKDKMLLKDIDLKDPDGQASLVFNEIRDKLRASNKGARDRDDPLGGVVTVRFAQEEDFIIERLSKYFMTLRDKFRTTRFNKVSYWDLERQIMLHKASFEEARKAAPRDEEPDVDEAEDEEEDDAPARVDLGIEMMDRPSRPLPSRPKRP